MESESIVMTSERIQEHMTPEKVQEYQSNFASFRSLSDRYWEDESLRGRVDAGDVGDLLPALGIELPSDMEVRIVADSDDTRYFVLPPDPNVFLSDETLSTVAGGGKTGGTAGTIGTAGSMASSTVPSTMSSAGTLGSVGTRG